jgi:hypothetical protein
MGGGKISWSVPALHPVARKPNQEVDAVAILDLDRSAAHDDDVDEQELTVRSPMSAWGRRLAPFAQSHRARSSLQLLTSVGAYLALSVLTYESISVSPLLALALAPLTGGFLARTFVVFHDCTHGSFWPSKRGNEWVGRLCGLLTLNAFATWRHEHAGHHATTGDLDRRGTGDLDTLTVAEYNGKSPKASSLTACSAIRWPCSGSGRASSTTRTSAPHSATSTSTRCTSDFGSQPTTQRPDL